MIRLVSSVVLLIVLVACGGQDGYTVVATTPPTPIFTPDPPPVRETGVIRELGGTLGNSPIARMVRVPSDGTLVGELTWEGDAELRLKLEDMSFPMSPPNSSPVVGRIPVLAGQSYRVTVSEGRPSRQEVADPWEHYGDEFVVRLSLE